MKKHQKFIRNLVYSHLFHPVRSMSDTRFDFFFSSIVCCHSIFTLCKLLRCFAFLMHAHHQQFQMTPGWRCRHSQIHAATITLTQWIVSFVARSIRLVRATVIITIMNWIAWDGRYAATDSIISCNQMAASCHATTFWSMSFRSDGSRWKHFASRYHLTQLSMVISHESNIPEHLTQ